MNLVIYPRRIIKPIRKKKVRKPIPRNVRIYILKYFNFRCVACGGEAHQIHHVDGNPSNNMLDNLVPVCFICHMIQHPEGIGYIMQQNNVIQPRDFILRIV